MISKSKLIYCFVKAFINAKKSQKLSIKKINKLQQRRFKQLQQKHLIHSPFYAKYANKPLQAYPIINKKIHVDNFDTINTVRLDKQGVFKTAITSEQSRDFKPDYKGYAVGLSSGTSGNRGLFVTSDSERAEWAGYIISKLLPFKMGKHRIAFFLRANNNLYESANGLLVNFHFFDLIQGIKPHISGLEAFNPTILIAPASVLVKITEQKPAIKPQKIISVAEVLEASEQQKLQHFFKKSIDQVYQCTEGFLAASCCHGNLHLNEDIVIIEKHWIDKASGRFSPIVTDLRRRTQPVIRYLLDDILIQHETPCPCGSNFIRLKSIEGRLDDILFLSNKNNQQVDVFPDFIRNAIISSCPEINEYSVIQTAANLIDIQITPYNLTYQKTITTGLNALWSRLNIKQPAYRFSELVLEASQTKRRRVQRLFHV